MGRILSKAGAASVFDSITIAEFVDQNLLSVSVLYFRQWFEYLKIKT